MTHTITIATLNIFFGLLIFIALIVTNCVIIGRAEAYASKNPPLLAALRSPAPALSKVAR